MTNLPGTNPALLSSTETLFPSVIICTRGRPKFLATAIASVLASAMADFELLVVDQSDRPDPNGLYDLLGNDPRVRYLPTATRGLSAARNSGGSVAWGDVLIFTDDDCTVAPNWIQCTLEEFKADPHLGLLFGVVLPAPDYASDQGYIPSFEPVMECNGQAVFTKGVSQVGMGANMAIRTAAFTQVGPFDTTLGAGTALKAGEDLDYAFRVFRQGYHIRHSKRAQVTHYGFRPWSESSQLVRGYALGITATYWKHIRYADSLALRLLGMHWLSRWLDILRRVAKRNSRSTGLGAALYDLLGILYSLRYSLSHTYRLYKPRQSS